MLEAVLIVLDAVDDIVVEIVPDFILGLILKDVCNTEDTIHSESVIEEDLEDGIESGIGLITHVCIRKA